MNEYFLNCVDQGIGFMEENDRKQERDTKKSIGKVVVFYDDKSFDELKP